MRTIIPVCLLALLACSRGPTEQAVAARAEKLMSPHLEVLEKGLAGNQDSMSAEEASIVKNALGAAGNLNLRLYLNRYGVIRWAPESGRIGITFDEYVKVAPTATNAIELSFMRKRVQAKQVPGSKVFEVSVPIRHKDYVVGILFFIAS